MPAASSKSSGRSDSAKASVVRERVVLFHLRLAETAFNPEYGLFRITDERLLFPNPDAWKYHAPRLLHLSLTKWL